MELGVFPLSLTPEAAVDPAFSELAAGTSFAHWHRDTFEAVPGAVRLALTERYLEQAFKLGPSYGLQFHPEGCSDARAVAAAIARGRRGIGPATGANHRHRSAAPSHV